MSQKIDRTGEKRYNNQGYLMEIIKYRSNNDLDVKFEDGGILKHCTYHFFCKGEIKNRNYPCVCGIGYIGYGDYLSRINGEMTIEYSTWQNMINRCYNQEWIKKHLCYESCSVSPEWHNFQNFARWYNENLWTKELKLIPDKDILIKNNKIYSPETVLLVDKIINNTFIRKNNRNLPVGVNFDKDRKKFRTQVKDNNCIRFVGRFNTIEEAFLAYKRKKELIIKKTADRYKNKYNNFPDKIYNALYNYHVEIDD